MHCEIRPILPGEVPLLADFLYTAIFRRAGEAPLPKSVIHQPELAVFIQDFGRPDDHCLLAVVDGRAVGAVWARILSGPVKGFGNVDDKTPEFAISVFQEHRGKGIGRRLMDEMLALLREKGYAKASLAVQKDNYAVRLYQASGFEITGQNDEEYIMVCPLK
ncbi:MAG: GNAT family N-acetyltransferase [Oscillospiraceae bacterium]|nr:GNAT family N-acetyltransferase [Oscillospiraceae bacterium]